MKPYGNESGRSGIVAYELRDDAIDVLFRDEVVYRYDYAVTGYAHVELMQRFARAGRGLASYINRYPEVRERFAAKWPLTEYRAANRDRR